MNESLPPSKQRALSLRLIREVLGELGWRYKLYIPLLAAISTVFLLPPRLLQFFTAETQSIGETSGSDFVRLLVIFGIAVAICLWIVIFLTGVLREWLRLKISVALRRDSLKALHRTRIEVLDDAHRGDWMTRVTSDLSNCEDFLSDSIPQQIQALTLALGSAVLFLLHSGPIALIPCVAAIMLAVLNARVQQKMAPVLRENRELEGEIFQSLMENYEGLRTIRSSGGEAQNLERLDGSLKRLFAAGMRIIRTMAALMGLNEFASQLVVTIALTVVAIALQGGEITAGAVLVYPFFINVFLSNARDLAAAAFDWNRFFIEGGRLASVIYNEEGLRGRGEEALPEKVDSLAAEGLVIGYGDAPPVIEGLDFSVQAGELVAVMGASGCGKSTFLECLAGLRDPRAGEFTVGGQRMERLPVRVASFVEQRPYLFVGTVRDNLLLGNIDAAIGDEVIWRALATVDLEQMIKKRGGLAAVLSDRGLNLSEGQRYRLTLCRALLAGRPFLLLDEPFAALDEDSIASVIGAIAAQRLAGVGVVLVTHVLPDDLRADRRVALG